MNNVRTPLLALMMTATFTGAVISACGGGAAGSGSSSSSSSSSGGASSSSSSSSSSTGGTTSSSGGGNSSSHHTGTDGGGGGLGDGGNIFSFDAAGFDAGFQPFSRTPTPGVDCGGTQCEPGGATAVCCIGLGGAACAATCSLGVKVLCDGQEDCTSGDVCCFVGLLAGASCAAPGACAKPDGGALLPLQMCNTTTECPAGSGCCESATLHSYIPSLSVGVCTVGCGL